MKKKIKSFKQFNFEERKKRKREREPDERLTGKKVQKAIGKKSCTTCTVIAL
jgi:hypothetical protein